MSSQQTITAPATNTRTMIAHWPDDQITGIADLIHGTSEVAAGTGITHIAPHTPNTITVMLMKEGADIVLITDQPGVRRTMSWKKDSICPERMRMTMTRNILIAEKRHRTAR